MVLRFAERPSGWPIGPEVSGGAWSCATPTVQIVEYRTAKRGRWYRVLTHFPFRYTDRRYPPSPLMPLGRARRFAFARLRQVSGSSTLRLGPGPGIEWTWGGAHFGLEVRL